MKQKPFSGCSEMAEVGNFLCMDQFSCPVCLDILKDPVTIPCGHSYCMGCIKGCWDQDDHVGIYSCPQCRQTFTSRPVQNRNSILAEVVEKLEQTGLQAASPTHPYAGPGDVECDVCCGRKYKAVKSCLVCLVSYCETHLRPHYNSPAFGKHKLTDATGHLKDKICSLHDKLLEIYCHNDQQCICYLCTMDEHRGHNTVSVAAERTQKQKQVGATQEGVKQRVQERDKELQELRQAVDSLKHSAQAAVDDSDEIFTELIRFIEERCSEVKTKIKDQEKAAVSQAESLIEKLEQEIADLRRRDTELEQLLQTEDNIDFIQSCQSLSVPPGSGPSLRTTVNLWSSFKNVRKAVTELKEEMESVCKMKFGKISQAVKKDIPLSAPRKNTFLQLKKEMCLPTPEPRTGVTFLQHACELTLDPNTVNEHLCLSERNTVVVYKRKAQSYSDHPDRFDSWEQVMCKEPLTGCCYLEVEWSGKRGVGIAVSYKGIDRKGWGDDSCFGHNDESWSLFCSPSTYCFRHSNIETVVAAPFSSRIGVYLDHRAGTLSFYRVSDTMTVLHRVQATFTEPLYAGFWLNFASSAKLLYPKVTK